MNMIIRNAMLFSKFRSKLHMNSHWISNTTGYNLRLMLPGMPNSAPQWFDIAACKHFKVSRLDLTRSFTRVLDGTTFNVLFVIDGSVTIESGGHNRKLSP